MGCILAAAGGKAMEGIPDALIHPLKNARSSPGFPLVRSFSAGEIPIRDGVRAVARTDDGTLVVGSNQLAIYDGQQWQRITVVGGYGYRALVSDKPDRIWVGGAGLLGQLNRDATGRWHFTSLFPTLMAQKLGPLGDVRSAHLTAEGVVFVTHEQVLRWNGAKFESWPLPASLQTRGFLVDTTLYLYEKGLGIFRMARAGPELVWPAAGLPEQPVHWLAGLPASRENESSPLLLGAGEGVYRIKNGQWHRLTEASDFLKDKLAVDALAIDDETLAVATLKAGVVLLSREGQVKGIVDSARGLPGDSVYSLLSAAGGGLWVGTEDGLALIDSVGAASLIDARSGLLAGLPRAVKSIADETYLVTSKGIWTVGAKSESGRLKAIVGTPSLIWCETVVHDRLWLGGVGGIWSVNGAKAQLEYATSMEVSQLLALRHHAGSLLFTEGYSLRELVRSPIGGWVSRDLVPNLSDTPLSLMEDSEGFVWVSTVAGTIYRFQVVPDGNGGTSLLQTSHFFPGHGLPDLASHPMLSTSGGRIFAFTETDILSLAPAASAFKLVPAAQDFAALAVADENEDGSADWVVRRKGLEAAALWRVKAGPENGSIRWQPLAAPGLRRLGRVSIVSVTGNRGNQASATVWIGGTQGILELEGRALSPLELLPRVLLRRISVGAPLGKGRGSAAFAVEQEGANIALAPGSAGPPTLNADTQTVRFDFAAERGLEFATVHYQTRLQGLEREWSPPQAYTWREFSGLSSRRYTFEVRSVDVLGRSGPPASYSFLIAAPWYWQPLAWFAYVATGLLLFFGTIRWRIRHLQQLNRRLDVLVKARTRQLELTNTAKSEFLENISHELRNPLNGIAGLTGMLREEVLPRRERDLARALKTCVANLQRVTEEVLGFSKLEYGAGTVENLPCRLTEVIEQVLGLHSALAAQQGSTLRVEYPAGFVDGFEGDGSKVRTIISNFVSNALKYAPGTPVVIAVELADDSAGEALSTLVTIEVRDQGPGIPVDEQELIFQKFVRGATAKKQGVAGTGLGLAACRTLAQKMGANIGVESAAGGSTFYLQVHLHRPSPAGIPVPAKSNATALIVEDEEYNRIVLTGMLEELGYRPTAVDCAPAAFAQLNEATFDVVFLDWELPGAKGGQVSRRLREQPGGHLPIVIATTANDSEEARQGCLDAGMDAFLLKPYDVTKVRRAIAQIRLLRSTHCGPIQSAQDVVVDYHALRFYSRGSPALVGREVAHFLRALEDKLTELQTAAAMAEISRVTAASHAVGALSGMAGAHALSQAAKALEKQAQMVDGTERDRLIAAVLREFESLKLKLG